jgi:Flp pilus assembly protein TadD
MYAIALILFLFSLLSKVSAATLPFVLLVVDRFLARPINRKTVFEKIPFLLLSFFLLWIGLSSSPSWEQKYNFLSLAEKFFFSSFSIPLYLIKVLWPYELCAFYPYAFLSDGSLPVVVRISPLLLAVLLGGIALAGRIKKDVFFGLSFFLITIVPMTQLFTTSAFFIADHYAYLPSIGILFLLARWINSLFFHAGKFQRHAKLAGMVILAGYFTSFAVLSAQRTLFWKDGISLWSDVIEKYPRVATAYINRGTCFFNQNLLKPAFDDFNKALALNPSQIRGYNNRGILYARSNQNALALADYNRALAIDPLFFGTYNNRGLLYCRQGRFDLALREFTRALEINPSFAPAYTNRANTYRELGQYDLAIKDYNQVLAIDPSDARALTDRAKTYQLLKDQLGTNKKEMEQKE